MEIDRMERFLKGRARIDRRPLALLLTLLLTASVQAEIYTWKDKNGKTRYSDKPPATEEAETVELGETNRSQAVTPSRKVRAKPTPRPVETPAEPSSDDKRQQACADALREYEDMTSIYRQGDSRTEDRMHIVYTDDKGKPITRREQNQMAERLRAEANRHGCNIPQAPNLKM